MKHLITLVCWFIAFNSACACLEVPLSSDSFVDSIGINIEATNEGTSPYNDIANVTATVKDLGIRHIRVFPIPSGTEIRNFVAIANGANAKLDFLIGRSGPGKWYIDTARNVIAPGNSFPLRKNYITPYLSSIESIEGPNEAACHLPSYLCLNGTSVQYPSGTVEFQNALWNTLRRPADPYDDSAPISLPLIGPAGCCDNLSASPLNGSKLDYENIHTYVDNGLCPDWGITAGTKYAGSYDFIANADAICSTKLPVIISETGYNTGSTADRGIQLPVSQLAQAKYQPRIFADSMLNSRIKKTYSWELFDSGLSGNANGTYGLVAQDSTGNATIKKPAYNAEKNLIALLKDPSTTSAPSGLYIDVAAPAQVEHLLLQKSNGDYYLLLWQEVPVYGYLNGKGYDISNQPVSVRVSFDKSFTSATQYSYDSGFNWVTSSIAAGRGFMVNAWDTITVVKIQGL